MISTQHSSANSDEIARKSAAKILYLDQNAWVELAHGAWDKANFPKQHRALTILVTAVKSGDFTIPLSFTNIYETAKINDPVKRANIALTQSLISGGRVFRGRRRILEETLSAYLADRFALSYSPPDSGWFLSDLWFESSADYSPEIYGNVIPERVLKLVRANPAKMLLDFLTSSDETVRRSAVIQFSTASADLISRIEGRRVIAGSEALAMRKRIYGASMILDEIEFILTQGRKLGFEWQSADDIGSSLVHGIVENVSILHVERELAVRLEKEAHTISENDLRDMIAFSIILPLADILVGEQHFVNLARQSRLGKQYATSLHTSVFDLASELSSRG